MSSTCSLPTLPFGPQRPANLGFFPARRPWLQSGTGMHREQLTLMALWWHLSSKPDISPALSWSFEMRWDVGCLGTMNPTL